MQIKTELINRKDAARQLKIPYARFMNWLYFQKLPEPTHVFGRRKYYTEEEVAEMAVMLKGKN